ncbi:eukaryotic mitochondrial regulator protein-domain-containing protein [Xylaria sp. CBS 124048]|nr:eukaryotic mitochondrial regulator protein-domain-containing protein [Xylaria sp. CBS 124048]
MPPLLPTPATAASLGIVRTSASAARPVVRLSQISDVASFSTTASRLKFSQARRRFRAWERDQGRLYRRPPPGKPVYLQSFGRGDGTRPFPLNRYFQSTRVLDEPSRELIWDKIVRGGDTIKAVSAEFGVDIRRVAAIVRLKEVEKEWVAEGKPLARPYARAVMGMLPQHHIQGAQVNEPYESINELHEHPYTMQQIFWPTSESRHFTRADAAKAFHPKLLSTDERVPHPELVQMEREILQGMAPYEASQRFRRTVMESERRATERQVYKAFAEERRTTRVDTDRFEFRFKHYSSEDVGRRGKARSAVGWRYGVPHDDRSKGREINIPTSVP